VPLRNYSRTLNPTISSAQLVLGGRLLNGSSYALGPLSVLSVPSDCDIGALWPNGWMDQDETPRGGRPRTTPHCVRRRPRSPSPNGGIAAPNFRPMYCSQTAGWIKKPLGTVVGLVPGDIVLNGDPSTQKGRSPQFSAHVYCGQTARRIKMPLGTKVGLGPCHIVLDGDQLPP